VNVFKFNKYTLRKTRREVCSWCAHSFRLKAFCRPHLCSVRPNMPWPKGHILFTSSSGLFRVRLRSGAILHAVFVILTLQKPICTYSKLLCFFLCLISFVGNVCLCGKPRLAKITYFHDVILCGARDCLEFATGNVSMHVCVPSVSFFNKQPQLRFSSLFCFKVFQNFLDRPKDSASTREIPMILNALVCTV